MTVAQTIVQDSPMEDYGENTYPSILKTQTGTGIVLQFNFVPGVVFECSLRYGYSVNTLDPCDVAPPASHCIHRRLCVSKTTTGMYHHAVLNNSNL